MTRHPDRSRAREAGFVLVGVVMFVIALTIIGLSLFSISSYEAQFLERSLDQEQAFQSAVGGLERAKFALCQTSRLESAGQFLPRENVVSAVAVQVQNNDTVSVGNVIWDPHVPVRLYVTAQVNGQTQALDASFAPQQIQNYYEQLMTVPGNIQVFGIDWATPPKSRLGTVLLDGKVWATSGEDTLAWEQYLHVPRPTPILTSPPVPVPDAVNFIAQPRLLRLVSNPPGPSGHKVYYLQGGRRQPRFLKTDDPSNPTFSLREDWSTGLDIQVRGCAVWMFPRGVRFAHEPTITGMLGGNQDCLVIVAGPNGHDPDWPTAGIWFDGGFHSTIPVILVSSGKVIIWHENNNGSVQGYTQAPDLSIFAESISLMGPEPGPPFFNLMQLHHPQYGLLNSQFVDFLLQYSALPNASTSTDHALALQSGTWHASGQ